MIFVIYNVTLTVYYEYSWLLEKLFTSKLDFTSRNLLNNGKCEQSKQKRLPDVSALTSSRKGSCASKSWSSPDAHSPSATWWCFCLHPESIEDRQNNVSEHAADKTRQSVTIKEWSISLAPALALSPSADTGLALWLYRQQGSAPALELYKCMTRLVCLSLITSHLLHVSMTAFQQKSY